MTLKNSAIPRPLPRVARFEKLAYGLFLHWGLYSQLGAGEWVMRQRAIPKKKYNRLQATFTAADFDARAWAKLARAAGMRYIVLTARHHEGFSLYDTRGLTRFDAVHSPAKRDLVAEFVTACRAEAIVPFLYHTTIDWQWWQDVAGAFLPDGGTNFAEYREYLRKSIEVLCTHYGPLGGLWFDGNWAHPKADWREDELYRMIRRLQPQAMIINNTGIGSEGVRGHPEIDSTTFEQSLPKPHDRRGWPKHVAGEMCQTMNAHWGIGARDFSYLSPAQIIANLVLSRKAGANYLLNVGPTAQGGIPEYESAALRRVGEWVACYDKVIREAKPAPAVTCTGRDFVLQAGRTFYYFAFDLPIQGNAHVTVNRGDDVGRLVRGLPASIKSARWYDTGERFRVERKGATARLQLPPHPYGMQMVVRIAELG